MQVINCASWHGQQRRQVVARRDSMAASMPNSHETSTKSRKRKKSSKIGACGRPWDPISPLHGHPLGPPRRPRDPRPPCRRSSRTHQPSSESAAILLADARAALFSAATSFLLKPGTERMAAPPPPRRGLEAAVRLGCLAMALPPLALVLLCLAARCLAARLLGGDWRGRRVVLDDDADRKRRDAHRPHVGATEEGH